MVFDRTLSTPLNLDYGLLFQYLILYIFSFWVSYHSKFTLIKKQTLQYMFETNFQISKLFL